MQPLIDSDLLCYEIGFATQKKDENGDIHPSPVEEVNQLIDNRIKEICAAVYATEKPRLFLTGKGNFRYDIAKRREYKGNRKQIKPFHYKYIRAYLCSQWDAEIVDGMEADDAMAIAQTERIEQRDTIICSRDKDLRIVPGYGYGWEAGKQGSWGPHWIDEMGTLELKGPKKLIGTGLKFFYSQLLTGDATDCYDGLPGCGPIRAYEVLKECKTEEELYQAVLSAYQAKFPEEAVAMIEEQAHLAWMVRAKDEEGNLIHWSAPV